MTHPIARVASAALLSLTLATPALAQGRPAGVGGGGGGGKAAQGQQNAQAGQQKGKSGTSKGSQVVQAARDFVAKLRANRQAAAQCARDLVAAAQAVLMLDEAGLDQLEADLEAAFDRAKTEWEALPAADQTEANLKPLIVTYTNGVFALATQDAAQLAALDAAAIAFADCIAPLEVQLAQERAAFHAQIQSLVP